MKKKIPPPTQFFFYLYFMQLFSADAMVKKQASKVAHNQPNPFFSQSSPDHSPELIFRIMKSWDQTSVLLFVVECKDSIN